MTTSIYIFIINSDSFYIESIPKNFPLAQWVNDFRHANDADNFDLETRKYTDRAYQLYEKLIAPVAQYLNPELIIVPDDVLGYLPFEALLVEPASVPNRFQLHHYLIKDKQISYTYSATLLEQMRNRQHFNQLEEGVLAFAPFYDSDSTSLASRFSYADPKDVAVLGPLPNSGAEISEIQQLMGGEVFYHQAATEKRFREKAPNYRLIHLSTHGVANDKSGDYSYLAFAEQKDDKENEFLFLRDLYSLSLQADMVVLSACETGIGELQKGEGIISLARGFAYAGAKSIFPTLWRVEDEGAKDLMLLFYKHLKTGTSKDKALRSAKLEYLDNLDNHPKAHPFYWSSIIGIGDMTPLKL